MSSAKCPTPFDVKFHWGECVKGNYNRMEQYQLASNKPLKFMSNLQV